MSSFSLSPVASVNFGSSSVVVSRLGWESSSRSILLWVRGSAVPLVCRTGGADVNMVAGLVALLRKSRDTGLPWQCGSLSFFLWSFAYVFFLSFPCRFC